MMGRVVTFEEIEECQPMAVPCQIGPLLESMSSGSRNVSLEVVKNSYSGKSEEKQIFAS